MNNNDQKDIYKFVCDFKKSNLEILYFLKLTMEWNNLSKQEKINTWNALCEKSSDMVENRFSSTLIALKKRNIIINIEEFRYFYNLWINLTPYQRQIALSTLLTNKEIENINDKIPYKGKVLLKTLVIGKNKDIREWDPKWANIEKMGEFGCRTCTYLYWDRVYSLKCPCCGSCNTYLKRTL